MEIEVGERHSASESDRRVMEMTVRVSIGHRYTADTNMHAGGRQ